MAEPATRTVERALALLARVCDRGGANLADTARDCDLAPSTALRLLRTLETTGFVSKDEFGMYRPGSRIIQLGAQALSDESLIELAAPAMEELATETGESVYLSVEGHAATALYISIVEGTHSVRHANWVGRTVPLDISAAGHVLRGKVPEDGYVVVERGVEADVTAIACPVYSQTRIVAALSLVVPSYRLTASQAKQYGRMLVSATADVSARLSSTPKPKHPRRTVMITFDEVSKVYPDGTVAVDKLTITAPNGKITVLVGPSGCGKTTSMRMINRLIEPSSGTIELDGVDTQTLDRVALRRRIGYVIQNAGLFPHRTVVDNVAALPRLLGGGKKETRSAAMELLERVGLDAKFAGRYPWQLSGGQQQRVGVARALATDPPFLLMDEPFSAVDPIVRNQLQDEFLRLQADISKTIVMVTHDIDEALKLGDQVAVLREGGTLAQSATPADLLAAPKDAFVADFVGSARGYRALGFHSCDDLLQLADEPTITVGQQVSTITASNGRWILVVDAANAPIGWVDTANVRGRLRRGARRQPQCHVRSPGRAAARPPQLGAVEPEWPVRRHRRVGRVARHRHRPRRDRRDQAGQGREVRRAGAKDRESSA